MIFGFVAKHRGIWPVAFLCEALGVSRSGFYAWLRRGPSARSRRDEVLSVQIRSSFLSMGAELSPNVGFQFSLVWRDEDCIGDQPLS